MGEKQTTLIQRSEALVRLLIDQDILLSCDNHRRLGFEKVGRDVFIGERGICPHHRDLPRKTQKLQCRPEELGGFARRGARKSIQPPNTGFCGVWGSLKWGSAPCLIRSPSDRKLLVQFGRRSVSTKPQGEYSTLALHS